MEFHLHSRVKVPVFLVVAAAFFAAASGASPAHAQAGPGNPLMAPVPEGATVSRDLPYVTNGDAKQKLDLYLPKEGRNLPLIIWIHGGAWMAGSKNLTGPFLSCLKEGYAVASIEYRFSQDAPFPAQIEDCKAAVRWLRANAAKYNLNPDLFAAWGPSAGGHLVAMLGTTGNVKDFDVGENLNVSSRVQAVVDYFGPSDLVHMSGHLGPGSPEANLIGGAIQDNPEKAKRASPVTYVSKDAPPFLIVHGDADTTVPYHQSELLTAALQQAGVPVTFYTVKGGEHGLGSVLKDPQVLERTRTFLAKYLKPAGP